MIDALTRAAQAAGIKSDAYARLIPESNAPPAERVAEFKRTHSYLFVDTVNLRSASDKESDAWLKDYHKSMRAENAGRGGESANDAIPKHVDAMTGAELTAFERRIGVHASHQDLAQRRREDREAGR